MRILGDSNIADATITATNILSQTATTRLQTFQLSDNFRTIANSTVIDFQFDGTIPDIDCIALCGTNLTPTSVITISYASVSITSPDYTEVISTFSSLNQILFLSTPVNKKYWRISISDSALTTLFVGYLYVGEYFQVPFTAYGHEASLNVFSNSSVTPTGQGYGGKIYNSLPVDFTMYMNYTDLDTYLSIIQEKQNIDPVLLVEYEESYDMSLYRPKYGVLSNTSIPFATRETNYAYEISARLEERF